MGRIIINFSIWEDLHALRQFVYQSAHAGILKRRWFEQLTDAYVALWWVPAGHRPTVKEAETRLLHLRAHGPTEYAFTLRTSFPPGPADPLPAPLSRSVS